MILLICVKDVRSGESPPCMHKILSSMIAATGIQLKQSTNDFHSLVEYLFLPTSYYEYILQRIHRCAWLKQTNDCLSKWRHCQGTWFCMRTGDILIRYLVDHDPHSLPRTSRMIQVEIPHIRTSVASQCTVRVCLRKLWRVHWLLQACFGWEIQIWQGGWLLKSQPSRV